MCGEKNSMEIDGGIGKKKQILAYSKALKKRKVKNQTTFFIAHSSTDSEKESNDNKLELKRRPLRKKGLQFLRCSSGNGSDYAETYLCIPDFVERYKSTDSLNKDRCNTIMKAFEIYYDRGKGFPLGADPDASTPLTAIQDHIGFILKELNVEISSLGPRYKAVMLAQLSIACLTKRKFDEGLDVANTALKSADKERLVGLTLRICSYKMALYRDQGKFGSAQLERDQAGQIYSSISSPCDLAYFHFNAGKMLAKYRVLCMQKEDTALHYKKEAYKHFQRAIYFATEEMHSNPGTTPDAIEIIRKNSLVQLATLDPSSLVEACSYLESAYNSDMPLLFKVYYCLAASDVFQIAKLVEESLILALWCRETCTQRVYKTELKMAEDRVQEYKTLFKEMPVEELKEKFLWSFPQLFASMLSFLKSIPKTNTIKLSDSKKRQVVHCVPIRKLLKSTDFREAETETGTDLDLSRLKIRELTTEDDEETELRSRGKTSLWSVEKMKLRFGKDTKPSSGENTEQSSGKMTETSLGDKTKTNSGDKTEISPVGKTEPSSEEKTETSSGDKTEQSSEEKTGTSTGEE